MTLKVGHKVNMIPTMEGVLASKCSTHIYVDDRAQVCVLMEAMMENIGAKVSTKAHIRMWVASHKKAVLDIKVEDLLQMDSDLFGISTKETPSEESELEYSRKSSEDLKEVLAKIKIKDLIGEDLMYKEEDDTWDIESLHEEDPDVEVGVDIATNVTKNYSQTTGYEMRARGGLVFHE